MERKEQNKPPKLENGKAYVRLKITTPQSIQNKGVPCPVEDVQKEYELLRMRPWFVHVGSRKLYLVLARILRLVGSSLITVLLYNSNSLLRFIYLLCFNLAFWLVTRF